MFHIFRAEAFPPRYPETNVIKCDQKVIVKSPVIILHCYFDGLQLYLYSHLSRSALMRPLFGRSSDDQRDVMSINVISVKDHPDQGVSSFWNQTLILFWLDEFKQRAISAWYCFICAQCIWKFDAGHMVKTFSLLTYLLTFFLHYLYSYSFTSIRIYFFQNRPVPFPDRRS